MIEPDDSSLITWEAAGGEATVQCQASSLMALAGSNGCGVLFGTRQAHRIAISSYRELASHDPDAASFSSMDEALLSTLIVAGQCEPDLWGLLPVGWYRVHHSAPRQDGVAGVPESDLDIYSRFFPETWQIALSIERNGAVSRANLLARDSGGIPSPEPVIREIACAETEEHVKPMVPAWMDDVRIACGERAGSAAAAAITTADTPESLTASGRPWRYRSTAAAWILGAIAGTLIALSIIFIAKRQAGVEIARTTTTRAVPVRQSALPPVTPGAAIPTPGAVSGPARSAVGTLATRADLRQPEKLSPLPARWVVPARTTITVSLDRKLDTRRSRRGERFVAVLEKPVSIGKGIVIPKGTRFDGHVSESHPSGRIGGRARLAIVLDYFHFSGQDYRIHTSMDTRVKGHRLAWLGAGLIVGRRNISLRAGSPLQFKLRGRVTATHRAE